MKIKEAIMKVFRTWISREFDYGKKRYFNKPRFHK